MAEQKFEKDLEKLEGIVESLEEGELSLDDSIKKFEEGITLYKRCERALSAAEKKIEMLTKNAEGELETSPMEDDGEDTATETPESDEGGELPF